MSIPANVLLAPHFTSGELGADTPGISSVAIANLYDVASWLEAARSILGVPLIVSSGYRTPEHNAAVGGSSTSDHPNGLAADFTPQGVSLLHVYTAFKDSDELPSFDQLIFYPVDNHIHVGLGPKMRGEYRLALLEGGYPLLTPDMLQRLGQSTVPILIGILIVALLVAAARKGS